MIGPSWQAVAHGLIALGAGYTFAAFFNWLGHRLAERRSKQP